MHSCATLLSPIFTEHAHHQRWLVSPLHLLDWLCKPDLPACCRGALLSLLASGMIMTQALPAMAYGGRKQLEAMDSGAAEITAYSEKVQAKLNMFLGVVNELLKCQLLQLV